MHGNRTISIKYFVMKKILIVVVIFFSLSALTFGQTKQASNSAALTKGIKTIELINGLRIKIEFNCEEETLWITGSTKNNPLFITEFIPLDNPEGIKLEIGKSYMLDNLYASVEYRILEIKENKVTRIWYRVAAKTTDLPQESWI